MSILNLFQKAASTTQKMTENVIKSMFLKRAKTPEQCKCIDFFLGTEEKKEEKKCLGCLNKAVGGWTVDDYIQHVENEVNKLNLRERAIAKIGLDESQISEIDPIVLSSFVRKGDDIYGKTSADHRKYVTNKYSLTWIFFSATQIYTYTYLFDSMSDTYVETTKDFFYSDITCIRTEHEADEIVYEINETGCLETIKNFFKKKEAKYDHYFRHWDTLQITVPNDSYSFCCKTTDLESMERSIQAAKAMIREKKQA